MNTTLNIDYSYTESALKAISAARDETPEGPKDFMTYRCSLHMLFHPQQTFLVTEVGMFWATEIVSVCANNHVWFYTMDEWKQKMAENPSFHATEIFDPLTDASLDVEDGEAVADFIQKQIENLNVKSKRLTPRPITTLHAAVANALPGLGLNGPV